MDFLDDQEICDILMEYRGKNDLVYLDLRIEQTRKIKSTIQSGRIRTEVIRDVGHGLRSLKNGYWGFSSSSEPIISRKILEERIKDTQSLIVESSSELSFALTEDKIHQTRVNLTSGHDFLTEEDIDEGIKLIQEVVEKLLPETVEAKIHYECEERTKKFISSEGSKIKQTSINYLLDIIFREGKHSYHLKEGNIGSISNIKEKLPHLIQTGLGNLQQASIARKIPSGEYSVVLNPLSSWLLVHESFGHAIEADTIIAGDSLFVPRLFGSKIAPDYVTIIDDPQVNALGSYAFDDDGAKATGTVLVEDGILTDFLFNRETAAILKRQTTGNSRAQDYNNFPLVRMSNFFIEPSDWSLDDLLDSKGLYIVSAGNGSAETVSGVFQLPVYLAYFIDHGEIVSYHRNFSLQGNMLDFLNWIEGVGKETEIIPGLCTKKNQTVHQGSLAPHVRVERVHVVSN